jgi:DNA replication protein DnaC
MKIPESLLKNMEYSSEQCLKHVKPIPQMIIDGKTVCPRCGVEKLNAEITEQEKAKYEEHLKSKQQNILYNDSLITDKTILAASFENYETTIKEEVDNLQLCKEIVERFKNGQVFNVFLQGTQGAGKSHLAYSMLGELNESGTASCLFVSVEDMLRKMKNSFNDKTSKYTEQYFVDLLSKVDFLVLDDIGSETGAIDTEKTATDFVQRILYAVTSTRQDKVTISTTNLASETLFRMYDKKLVSRLLRNPKYVLFKETKDKRMSNIPF